MVNYYAYFLDYIGPYADGGTAFEITNYEHLKQLLPTPGFIIRYGLLVSISGNNDQSMWIIDLQANVVWESEHCTPHHLNTDIYKTGRCLNKNRRRRRLATRLHKIFISLI